MTPRTLSTTKENQFPLSMIAERSYSYVIVKSDIARKLKWKHFLVKFIKNVTCVYAALLYFYQ